MGILYLVATPIGNLGDITFRSLEILNNVDMILCEDTRTSSILLKHFNINKKCMSYHKFNENSSSSLYINELLSGKKLALITDAGCPCVSDPGYILVRECIKNNIEVIGIPGASAVITSLMVSGLNSESFSFYGFLDRENKKIIDKLEIIKNSTTKLSIIYESPKRLIKTLSLICDVLENPNICVCNDLTKKFEKKYYGNCNDVICMLEDNDKSELGEYVIVIENKDYVKEEDDFSIESMLVDEMIKQNITLKESIKVVSDKYRISKNIVYDASIKLKGLFK